MDSEEGMNLTRNLRIALHYNWGYTYVTPRISPSPGTVRLRIETNATVAPYTIPDAYRHILPTGRSLS